MANSRVLPPRFDCFVERVMERDRAYFSQHPEHRAYVRVYVPGEFWPLRGSATYVRVTLLADGLRFREPLPESLVDSVIQ
jgi:hypothetical protein